MKPRWKSGSMGMLTVNALFAAFSGALLIGLALSPPPAGAMWFDLSSFFAFGALASFALAAEWITDALDEDSLPKYLRSAWCLSSPPSGSCSSKRSISGLVYWHSSQRRTGSIILDFWWIAATTESGKDVPTNKSSASRNARGAPLLELRAAVAAGRE